MLSSEQIEAAAALIDAHGVSVGGVRVDDRLERFRVYMDPDAYELTHAFDEPPRMFLPRLIEAIGSDAVDELYSASAGEGWPL